MNPDALTSVFVDSIIKSCPEDQPFLSDQSPQDKPWDIHKSQSVKVSDALSLGYESHQKQSERMIECAKNLEFGWRDNQETGETALKLKTAYFCRVRHCPICQWRRSLMWVARFYQAFPKIYADHPEWRYIMVTFTVRNCKISDLRETINEMNTAWHRLINRKAWPGLGFVRSTEVTRGSWIMKSTGKLIPAKKVHTIPLELRELKDKTTAHPHYHCLIAVPPGYLQGKNYLSTAKWANLWQECLRSDYTPICYANVVKPKDYSEMRGKTIWETPEREQFELGLDEVRNAVRDAVPVVHEPFEVSKLEYIFSAIKEVVKYAVKPDDMLLDPEWLIELSTQLKNSRAVALGGEFKKYLSEDEPTNQELIGEAEKNQENDGGVFFGWRERLERYQRVVNK
jgi:plasmid rolling circle replication initiator protein Rep